MDTAPQKGFQLLVLLLLLGVTLSSSLIVWYIRSQNRMTKLANVVQKEIETTATAIPSASATPIATETAQPISDHPQVNTKPQKPKLRTIAQ